MLPVHGDNIICHGLCVKRHMSQMAETPYVAQVIRDIRRELGLSQEEFARRLGASFTQAQVSRWETGKVVPSRMSLERIAEISGRPISDFFQDRAQRRRDSEGGVIAPELARRLVEGSAFLGRPVQIWLINEIENAHIQAGIGPEDWPGWLKDLRSELGL